MDYMIIFDAVRAVQVHYNNSLWLFRSVWKKNIPAIQRDSVDTKLISKYFRQMAGIVYEDLADP